MTTRHVDAFEEDGESSAHDGDFEGVIDSVPTGGRGARHRAAWSRIEDILDQRRLSRELADFDDDL